MPATWCIHPTHLLLFGEGSSLSLLLKPKRAKKETLLGGGISFDNGKSLSQKKPAKIGLFFKCNLTKGFFCRLLSHITPRHDASANARDENGKFRFQKRPT